MGRGQGRGRPGAEQKSRRARSPHTHPPIPKTPFSSSSSSFILSPSSVLVLDDRGPFRQVHPVQELADVLLADVADHVDQGRRPGDELDVVAGDDQLILHAGRPLDRHARQHAHRAHPLLAQEVADLDQLAALLDVDVDGEVGVHQAHLVLKTLGDALDEVLDVGARRPDGGQLLALAERHLDAHHLGAAARLGVVRRQEHVDGQVLEVAGEGACGWRGERGAERERESG